MSVILLLAALLAFALGAVAAILMRVAGLVALMAVLAVTGGLRMALGYPHPTWADLTVTFVALQLGYALAALGPWADGRSHKRHAASRRAKDQAKGPGLGPKDETTP